MSEDFIVSLTSHSKRINTIHLCLRSVFEQTLRPKKVVLYLDSSLNPNVIPDNIIPFTQMGLNIIFVSDQIGPHNKYYYTIKHYPNETVITIDDDVIYEKTTFENLLNTHQKYPNSVCANRVKYMVFDNNHLLTPYNDWISEYDKILTPSKKLIATGVGGVLYPPNTFTKSAFNMLDIIKLALTADDIWLKIMELLNGVPVVWTGKLPQHPQQIPGTMDESLWRTINKSKNDEYIKRITEYYQLDLYSLTYEKDNYVYT